MWGHDGDKRQSQRTGEAPGRGWRQRGGGFLDPSCPQARGALAMAVGWGLQSAHCGCPTVVEAWWHQNRDCSGGHRGKIPRHQERWGLEGCWEAPGAVVGVLEVARDTHLRGYMRRATSMPGQ